MLVTAAPSGVGIATLQLAKYLGANVIGTETLPYIPAGQWSPVTAYRKNLKGVIIAPALFMWNVEKT